MALPETQDAYAAAGVDIDAGEALVEKIKPFAKATARKGTMGGLGGFGALFDLKDAGFKDPVLVASNDGVGTKLKIAIETGLHNTIGIDLVAMCANDVAVQGAEPLFFLDYFACGKLDVAAAAKVIEGIAEGCRQAGAALIGGETAEMPGLYAAHDYDLAGFCVGAAERGKLLPRGDVAPGDVILGVASSGVHSNGFSLVRKILADNKLSLTEKAPFATGKTLGEVLIEPTRIYVKAALNAHATGKVKAFAHITGGGLPGNVGRVLPPGTSAEIDLDKLPVPQVFSWLQTTGGIAEADMLRTFNCGVGFIAVVSPGEATIVKEAFAAAGEKTFVLGAIKTQEDASAPAKVTFSGRLDIRS